MRDRCNSDLSVSDPEVFKLGAGGGEVGFHVIDCHSPNLVYLGFSPIKLIVFVFVCHLSSILSI